MLKIAFNESNEVFSKIGIKKPEVWKIQSSVVANHYLVLEMAFLENLCGLAYWDGLKTRMGAHKAKELKTIRTMVEEQIITIRS